MPALQVRDLPADLYEKLRERARQEHRSVAQQTIVAIECFLDVKSDLSKATSRAHNLQQRTEKHRALFERINSRPPLSVPEGFPTPEELIREDRDSR